MSASKPGKWLPLEASRGISLVELIIALGLIVVVLAGGYMFFHFGNVSFVSAEVRSDLQQNVRIAAGFITREVRYATAVKILAPTAQIPTIAPIPPGVHYIFLNTDGDLEYRTRNTSRLVLEGIADKVTINLNFYRANTTGDANVLAFTITGTRDTGQLFTLTSEVFLENLYFNERTITGSVPSSRLRFVK